MKFLVAKKIYPYCLSFPGILIKVRSDRIPAVSGFRRTPSTSSNFKRYLISLYKQKVHDKTIVIREQDTLDMRGLYEESYDKALRKSSYPRYPYVPYNHCIT